MMTHIGRMTLVACCLTASIHAADTALAFEWTPTGSVTQATTAQEERYYVVGSVGKPGVYRLTEQLTVEAAIRSAGGIHNESGAPVEVRIIRAEGGKKRTIVASKAALIRNGDVVQVTVKKQSRSQTPR